MQLRPADDRDLAFILALEEREDVSPWITPWSPEAHLAGIDDPDGETLILVGEAGDPAAEAGQPLGFAILSGLASPHRAIELTRLVVAQQCVGHGRLGLAALMAYAFAGEGAHRLWLDVFEDNTRARRLYVGMGFSEEGRLRDAVRSHGRFRSVIIMSLLETDPAVTARFGAPAASGAR